MVFNEQTDFSMLLNKLYLDFRAIMHFGNYLKIGPFVITLANMYPWKTFCCLVFVQRDVVSCYYIKARS